MFHKQDVSFKTQDGIQLHGWLYLPYPIKTPFPCIIMTHGFTALKEHHLAKFAEVFVHAGMAVLIYDHRHFGASPGEPRFEVNPSLQIQDMRDAITFLTTKKEIDSNHIGLWGNSFSGGHVIVVAAMDKRVHCVVTQVPFVKGHHDYLKTERPDLWEIIQRKYVADREARALGKSPAMTPVVAADANKSVVMQQQEAYDFFTSIPEWKNQVTLKSLELAGDYAPIDYVQQISPIPILFIIADQDTICLTDLALAAFEKALPPKKCVMIKGHHFSPYDQQFDLCAKEACEWFGRWFSV